jgi:hypothetical protein
MTSSEIILNYENYPIVPVRFKYKQKKTPVIEALLDSGGDFIVIPMPIAKYLEMDLDQSSDVDTAGGTTCMYRTEVDMIIGKKDCCTSYFNREIHVSSQHDIPILLGRNPLFEDYEITFRKQKHQLILKPLHTPIHDTYPTGF